MVPKGEEARNHFPKIKHPEETPQIRNFQCSAMDEPNVAFLFNNFKFYQNVPAYPLINLTEANDRGQQCPPHRGRGKELPGHWGCEPRIATHDLRYLSESLLG